jgi:hypothetical protein
MGRACSTNVEKRNVCRLSEGKPEGKRLLERPTYRWLDNMNMNFGEIGWHGVDWISLAQKRENWRALVNVIIYCLVP